MSEIKNVEYGLEKIFDGAQDFLPLLGTDYVEFYVGNAKQAAHFYKTAFGFQSLAYAGLETGVRDKASYVLAQDKIRLVLTTPLTSDSPINTHLAKHGDGVKVIALWVEDATKSFEETTKRGAKPFMPPTVEKDEHGEVVRSGIYTYGETVHIFVERKNYKGTFLPGYQPWKSDYNPTSVGLKFIDHMVGNVGWGEMNQWVKWYEDVMGFVNFLSFDDKQIHTEYSALMSKVMSNGNGRIKFPINEPAEGKKKSQIEEYLDFYEGPGVQHIAVATDDIIKTVSELRARGVEFLSAPPPAYYEEIPARLGEHMSIMKEDIAVLEKLAILVDADEDGYLLQIFTKPVEDRPTLFFEIIQRMGAKGFGAGNFKALFESIEREQEKEGHYNMNFNYGFILESTAKKIKLELQRKFNEIGVDITVDQWVVLLELHQHSTQNQVELCERCAKDAPTITRIIELLVKKELILREECKTDRRKFNISLSKKGKNLIQKLLPVVVEFRKQGWNNLTEKDIAHIERITRKIKENLKSV